jgi:hypothetical protein
MFGKLSKAFGGYQTVISGMRGHFIPKTKITDDVKCNPSYKALCSGLLTTDGNRYAVPGDIFFRVHIDKLIGVLKVFRPLT